MLFPFVILSFYLKPIVISDQKLIALLSFLEKTSFECRISSIDFNTFSPRGNLSISKISSLPITFTNKLQVKKND